jgi:hypothetical protein
VVVSEQRIPERWSLKDYVIHLQSQLARVLAESELYEPHSLELVGADEAIQLTIRQPPSGGIALVQQQIYVRAQQTVGCAVLITTSDEFEDLAAEFTSIRRTMEFRADAGPPIRCYSLTEPGIHAESPPTTERLERCA